jgi:hypothetical protein
LSQTLERESEREILFRDRDRLGGDCGNRKNGCVVYKIINDRQNLMLLSVIIIIIIIIINWVGRWSGYLT